MSHSLQLSDETYEALRELASEAGETPEALISTGIAYHIEVRSHSGHNPYTEPRYYTTDEWFHHLGMIDDEIAEADSLADDDESEAAE